MTRLILDLSRTLSRAVHRVPTGIDRVEMAYAEGMLARVGDRVEFAAMHPLGRFGTLPRKATEHFLTLTAQRWREGGGEEETAAVGRAARTLLRSVLVGGDLPSGSRLRGRKRDAAYLLMSHHHLDRRRVLESAIRRRRAAFICLVHDLIPIDFKEYARPEEPARHQRRIESVARFADGIVVNSHATQRSLQPWLDRAGRAPPVLVAPLGADAPRNTANAAVSDGKPYFLLLGTIEPRKNHLLALQIWRRLVAELGPDAPRLLLVGRRGWEIEHFEDMVERCDALQGVVTELGEVSDAESHRLMQGARALLMPSFAEGYGLPIAEALAHRLPVLCSDLPAFREVGRDVPEYFDPLDGIGLLRAVRDYSEPGSARRAAQVARMQHWRTPSWADHVSAALCFADDVVRANAGADLDTGGWT